MAGRALTAAVLAQHEGELLAQWIRQLKQDGSLSRGSGGAALEAQCAAFLKQLKLAMMTGQDDVDGAEFESVRESVNSISNSRAAMGHSPRETAVFMFSLKQPIFEIAERLPDTSPQDKLEFNWSVGKILDRLGLLAVESHQRSREELISRQSLELSELSTPVIKLWDGVLALPLIGTLDSQRAQVIMENLLDAIVAKNAEMAIIDITGVPTVDTLTAQHLLKTIAAARLMGAECIISGIRPQIAQTMVHLGVDLSVVSKANLADAFAVALAQQGRAIVKLRKSPSDSSETRE